MVMTMLKVFLLSLGRKPMATPSGGTGPPTPDGRMNCQPPCAADRSRARIAPIIRARRALERSCNGRSEEHTSELQSLMRISYAVFCLNKKKQHTSIKNQ